MSELVERVALAMCEAAGFDPVPDLLEGQARAAIAAVFNWMGEPSEAATDAGYGEMDPGCNHECNHYAAFKAMLSTMRREALGDQL